MSALHPKLHPAPTTDTEEPQHNALNGGAVQLPARHIQHLDTDALAYPATHQDAEKARACVSENDTGCPLSAPESAPAIGGVA